MIGCGLLAGAVLQGIGGRATETADASGCSTDEPPMATPAVPYAVTAGK